MKYRSRTDIVSQILNAANGGTTKPKIMYKAYLSYAQLKEYLSSLSKTDFWNTKLASRSKTTEKGMKFMRIYQHIDELTGPMLE